MARIATEMKIFSSRTVTLTDRRDIYKINNFVKSEKNKFSTKIKKVWKNQREMIGEDETETILKLRTLPQRVLDKWSAQIRDFVAKEVFVEYIEAIRTSGEGMMRRVNKQRKQHFEFDATSANSLIWVNENGGRLIVELTRAQYEAVHALMHHQVFMGITSPYQLQQMLTPLIGLTSREATAVLRFRMELIAQGLDPSLIETQVSNYSAFLHRNRASRIARTELAKAYNFGQHESIIQALHSGYVEGEIEKTWLSGGSDRMCEDCDAMDGETVSVNEPFSNGLDTPPAHPQCRCSVGYQVIRRE